MATERKRKERTTDAHLVRERGMGVEAHVDCTDDSVPPEERRNLSLWLNYQLARWLVRTGRRGCWKITATIERKEGKRK